MIPSYQGPYPDKQGGGYRVRWTEDGKGRSKRFPDEQTAREFMRQEPSAPPGSTPAPDGSSTWWGDRLAGIAYQLLEAEAAGDAGRANELRATARAISSLAIAAKGHVDTSALEKRLSKLELEDKEKRATRKHGARAQRTARPSRAKPVPGEPIQ